MKVCYSLASLSLISIHLKSGSVQIKVKSIFDSLKKVQHKEWQEMNKRCCCGSNGGLVKTLWRLVLIFSCFMDFVTGQNPPVAACLWKLHCCHRNVVVQQSGDWLRWKYLCFSCLCTLEPFSCLCEKFYFLICTLPFCLISIPRCASGCFWCHIINKTGSTVCHALSFRSWSVLLQTVQIWAWLTIAGRS